MSNYVRKYTKCDKPNEYNKNITKTINTEDHTQNTMKLNLVKMGASQQFAVIRWVHPYSKV